MMFEYVIFTLNNQRNVPEQTVEANLFNMGTCILGAT